MFTDEVQVLQSLESGFGQCTVLVVGDLMLDRYIWGAVQRISPEAPVPVVKLRERTDRPGGAGNVAMNLAGLGLRVELAGLLGEDESAATLLALFQEAGIETSALTLSKQRPTITKTRIIGGHQQMLRIDDEEDSPIDLEQFPEYKNRLLNAIAAEPDVLILSDYAKGGTPEPVCNLLLTEANKRGIPVLVDPKGKAFSKYAGATTLTPNKLELALATGCSTEPSELKQAGNDLRTALGLDHLIVTLGEDGIRVHEEASTAHFPATAREVFDVSGAGDTVAAVVAAGMAAGLSLTDRMQLANLAAGVVVGKVGTVPITRSELIEAVRAVQMKGEQGKVMALETLVGCVSRWREQGQTVVFTNGCFDLLHAGHVTYIERAKLKGDRLIIGLNTDASVRRLKGPERPVITEQDRARVLAALGSVDAVVLFEEDTPLNLITALRPDVLVKGSDYKEHEVVGGKEVKSWGGRVELVQVLSGRSSSTIMEQIKN